MICRNCGEPLQDTDDFCPKCGQPAIKEVEVKICPNCGAVLRTGSDFCHKCGTKVVSEAASRSRAQETFEDRSDERRPMRRLDRPARYEEPEDFEDEYDDDLDDEYEDDEEDGGIFGKIIIALLGIVIAVVVLILGFILFFKGDHAEPQEEPTATEQSVETGDSKDAAPSGKTITVNGSGVNIRSKASKSGEKVGTAQAGTVYTYTDIENGWYKIELPDGGVGYVYGDYVTEN